jgi:hypothetical protein
MVETDCVFGLAAEGEEQWTICPDAAPRNSRRAPLEPQRKQAIERPLIAGSDQVINRPRSSQSFAQTEADVFADAANHQQ